MREIRNRLRRTAVITAHTLGGTSLSYAPKDLVGYGGFNTCGEIQGNGNIDMLIATLIAKREQFAALVSVLGYRVTE